MTKAFPQIRPSPGRRSALAALVALVALAAISVAPPSGAQPAEGREYQRLKNPQAVDTGRRIEVIEFFSYGCPHCADLEPHLNAWFKRMPADVQFKRVPVMFQQAWENLARVYYTLESLGEEHRLSPDVFQAIHGARNNLATEQRFFDWAATKGLDRKKVEDTYRSFGVNGKVARAKQIAQAYNVQSVPLVIVDGKFQASSDRAGGHSELPNAIDAAVAKARAERPKS
ncbi:MAG: thiol:disulfide interchange protein DsbA/DsbL [Burkholderiales bacterium]|nr:thiol:disulfide interchange protein DsbA/DsbL [Burkholderiales bacterium]